MGVVTTKAEIQGKLTNRGTTCMFLGYSVDHSNNLFRMLSLESKKIINSRHVVWLEKNFKIWSKSKLLSDNHEFDDDNDDLITKVRELNRVNREDENVYQQPALSEKTKDKSLLSVEAIREQL